jgi:hypothetical protein
LRSNAIREGVNSIVLFVQALPGLGDSASAKNEPRSVKKPISYQ